jgi:hypothetical protein
MGWLIAFGSEILGGFLGALAAGFIAKSHARRAAAILIGLAVLGSLNNWRMFSHPSWFMIGQILAYPAVLWLAWRILPGAASGEASEAAEA